MAVHNKLLGARRMMRSHPDKWFRGAPLDERDRALLDAQPPAHFLMPDSYLRKIYHMKAGEEFKMTNWVVENDAECKDIVGTAGGRLIGFDIGPLPPVSWRSVTVNVNMYGTPGSGFDWGFLSTAPANIRIFKGPPETCETHPWDAMILRDCHANTDTLGAIRRISSRKWDMLIMMCEDKDFPWLVCAIKDAGHYEPPALSCTEHDHYYGVH